VSKKVKVGVSPIEKVSSTEVLRKCSRLMPFGEWVEVKFSTLEKGDVFRLTEPDGRRVESPGAPWVVIADSDPFVNEDGVVSIHCHGLRG
jgi:hypothetical protein